MAEATARRRTLSSVLLVGSFLTLAGVETASSIARAESPSDDPTTKAARARFQEGVEFYDKGQYENARAAFLQAYALKKHPTLLLNLAQSHLKTNRPLEALRYFQRFSKESHNPTPQQKELVKAGLAEARERLGRLDVTVVPDGTEVLVDGESVGTSPLAEPLDVDVGTHTVKVHHPDGRELSSVVRVGFGQTVPVRMTLPAPLSRSVPPAESRPRPQEAPAESGSASRSDAAAAGSFTALTPKESDTAPKRPMAPFWIGLGVGTVGTITAIAFAISKAQAQDNADSVDRLIRQEATKRGRDPKGICASTDPAVVDVFGKACGVYKTNLETVDQDAAVVTVGIVAAAVGFTGAATWYFLGPQGGPERAPAVSWKPPTPWYGPGAAGLTLRGEF